MKTLLVAILILMSATAFSQYHGSVLSLNSNNGVYNLGQGLGFLIIEAEVAQSLNDIDERVLRELKIDLLNKYFEIDNGWSAKASFVGYQIRNNQIMVANHFRLKQIRLINAEIIKVTSLGSNTSLTLKAGLGFGYHSAAMADQQELRLSNYEFEALKRARNCQNCSIEGVKTAGSLPVTGFINAQINYKKSYLSLYGDFQRSGMYRRLLDESGEQYQYGYRMIFNWERRNLIRSGIEIGRDFNFKNIPMTVFGRAQYNHFSSTANIAEQGDADFYETKNKIVRDPRKLGLFEVGVRINLKKNRN